MHKLYIVHAHSNFPFYFCETESPPLYTLFCCLLYFIKQLSLVDNPYTSSITSYEQGVSKQDSPITTEGGSYGCWDTMKEYL